VRAAKCLKADLLLHWRSATIFTCRAGIPGPVLSVATTPSSSRTSGRPTASPRCRFSVPPDHRTPDPLAVRLGTEVVARGGGRMTGHPTRGDRQVNAAAKCRQRTRLPRMSNQPTIVACRLSGQQPEGRIGADCGWRRCRF
jgi:hypothetical protein